MKRIASFETVRRRRRHQLVFLKYVLLVFVLFQAFTAFGFKSWRAASASMEPNLEAGDLLMVLPSAYGLVNPFNERRLAFREPVRGDVVLVRHPNATVGPWYLRFVDSALRFATLQRVGLGGGVETRPVVKRVIAVPGDSVMIRDHVAYVKAAGSAHFLTEYEVSGRSYDLRRAGLPEGWRPDLPLSGDTAVLTLGPGEYYVVGDNRPASTDSRFFGPVSADDILGKAAFRYWPPGRISGL